MVHQETQKVLEQQEQSPVGWHMLEGARKPHECHDLGTVLFGGSSHQAAGLC